MQAIVKILGLVILLAGIVIFAYWNIGSDGSGVQNAENNPSDDPNDAPVEEAAVIAEDLEIPWDIAFLPSESGTWQGDMLVTERPGRVVHVTSGRVFPISGVEHVGEGGLLGIALHPDFLENRFVYLYQTTRTDDGLYNRVVRYRYRDDEFAFDRVILSDLPGAPYHDGGRVAFGPDGFLYVAIGDAGDTSLAQDTGSLAGSILRVRDDGSVPEDNPFGNEVYSYGHRNPQGLAWDAQGRLWSTEHGRSGVLSGLDEINRITAGANYGWPESQGDITHAGTVAPALHSGTDDTWAPASALYHEGSLFFGGLRGEALFEAVIEGGEVVELKEHFKGEFGRIRTVALGPDGLLYLTTSNRDGRGSVRVNDDKIVRVHPQSL
jgi:glucose/arabinose dehydrogenase